MYIKNKLELRWSNKDKTFYFGVITGRCEWIDKKDPEVFSKAHKAWGWCKMVTEATKRKWIYKLVLHSAVTNIDSFEGIISSAIETSET